MDVAAVIADALGGWRRRPGPASGGAVADLAAAAGIQLPIEYLDLLRLHDGGEGELGGGPAWFEIWPAATVISSNLECQAAGLPPGFFGFGSTGSGEMFALDHRGSPPYPVIMMPYIPFDARTAEQVTPDFAAFVRLLGRKCP
jgi:hypothetical protein